MPLVVVVSSGGPVLALPVTALVVSLSLAALDYPQLT